MMVEFDIYLLIPLMNCNNNNFWQTSGFCSENTTTVFLTKFAQ